MPWVHEELRHDHFLDDFWNVVLRRFYDKEGNQWWIDFNSDIEKVDIFKVSFEPGLFTTTCEGDYLPNHDMPGVKDGGYIAITRHMIIRRWDGELLGMAQSTGAIKFYPLKYSKDPEFFLAELQETFYNTTDYTTLYTYMLEDYLHYTHHVAKDKSKRPITYIVEEQGNGVLASSLDIEFHNDENYEPNMYQSPIVSIDLIHGNTFNIAAIGKLNYRTDTNWWNDSKILVQGNIDTRSFCFILRADTAPMWHDNKVPQTPFFFGDIVGADGSYYPVAMFGGRAVDKYFDFDNVDIITNEGIVPTTRNYVYYPSNGIDSVMLKRTKYGARYQAHYLQWETPPNDIEPERFTIEINPEVIKILTGFIELDEETAEPVTETQNKFQLRKVTTQNMKLFRKCTHIIIGDRELVRVLDYDIATDTITVERTMREAYHERTRVIGLTPDLYEMIKLRAPRKWNKLQSDTYYKYTPHPSRYSGKVHTSRLYIVHPEDGVVGEIPNAVVASSVNLFDGTRLTFTKYCVDCNEEDYNPPIPPSQGITVWQPYPNSLIDDGGNPTNPTDPTDPTGDPAFFGGTVLPEDVKPFDPNCESILTPDGLVNHTGRDTWKWSNQDMALEQMLTTQFGKGLDGLKYWDGIDLLMQLFKAIYADSSLITRFDKGQETDTVEVENIVRDFIGIPINEGWGKFHNEAYATYGISECASSAQKASIFLTNKLKLTTIVDETCKDFCVTPILEEMGSQFSKIHIHKLVNMLRFRENIADSEGVITGAFVHDQPELNMSDGSKIPMKPYLGVMNIEPQLLQYTIESSETFNPVDYVKNADGFSDFELIPNAEYDTYRVDYTKMSTAEKLGKVCGSIAIHELGHAIDNIHFDLFGTALTDEQGWKELSGWDSVPDGTQILKPNEGKYLSNGKIAPPTVYACTNPAEDFGESYAFYKYNPEFLQFYHPEKFNYIQSKEQAIFSALGI